MGLRAEGRTRCHFQRDRTIFVDFCSHHTAYIKEKKYILRDLLLIRRDGNRFGSGARGATD